MKTEREFEESLKRHIWEGWTVGDFVNCVYPSFIRYLDDLLDVYNEPSFKSYSELHKWVKNEMPYTTKGSNFVASYLWNIYSKKLKEYKQRKKAWCM